MNRVAVPLIKVLLTIAMAVGFSACSSKSFSASSRSSSSPSRWLSASSRSGRSAKPDEKPGETSVRATQNSFQEEVSALTVLYAQSGGSADDFHREVGTAAQRHGISFWEGVPAAYEAIGRGLARAQVPKEAFAYLPFLQNLKTSAHYGLISSSYNAK